jgi:hypothetical protein
MRFFDDSWRWPASCGMRGAFARLRHRHVEQGLRSRNNRPSTVGAGTARRGYGRIDRRRPLSFVRSPAVEGIFRLSWPGSKRAKTVTVGRQPTHSRQSRSSIILQAKQHIAIFKAAAVVADRFDLEGAGGLKCLHARSMHQCRLVAIHRAPVNLGIGV